jgi:hypothetical protein
MEYSQEMEKFPSWRQALHELHGIPAQVLGLTPLFEGLAEKLTTAAQHVDSFGDYKITFTHGFTVRFLIQLDVLALFSWWFFYYYSF